MSSASKCRQLVFLCLLCISSSPAAWADDEGHGGHWWQWGGGEGRVSEGLASAPPQYQKECASCHMAYPAGLLPAGSWQHLMANLGQHYGNDASIDAATGSVIAQYLTGNAGTYKRVNEMPPQDRITQSAWFMRKHNKHVDASSWARPSIGSRANCVACHSGAAQGNFNEHSVRIPD